MGEILLFANSISFKLEKDPAEIVETELFHKLRNEKILLGDKYIIIIFLNKMIDEIENIENIDVLSKDFLDEYYEADMIFNIDKKILESNINTKNMYDILEINGYGILSAIFEKFKIADCKTMINLSTYDIQNLEDIENIVKFSKFLSSFFTQIEIISNTIIFQYSEENKILPINIDNNTLKNFILEYFKQEIPYIFKDFINIKILKDDVKSFSILLNQTENMRFDTGNETSFIFKQEYDEKDNSLIFIPFKKDEISNSQNIISINGNAYISSKDDRCKVSLFKNNYYSTAFWHTHPKICYEIGGNLEFNFPSPNDIENCINLFFKGIIFCFIFSLEGIYLYKLSKTGVNLISFLPEEEKTQIIGDFKTNIELFFNMTYSISKNKIIDIIDNKIYYLLFSDDKLLDFIISNFNPDDRFLVKSFFDLGILYYNYKTTDNEIFKQKISEIINKIKTKKKKLDPDQYEFLSNNTKISLLNIIISRYLSELYQMIGKEFYKKLLECFYSRPLFLIISDSILSKYKDSIDFSETLIEIQTIQLNYKKLNKDIIFKNIQLYYPPEYLEKIFNKTEIAPTYKDNLDGFAYNF